MFEKLFVILVIIASVVFASDYTWVFSTNLLAKYGGWGMMPTNAKLMMIGGVVTLVGAIGVSLSIIRDVLEAPSDNAIEFIDNFKLSLFSEEIYVFTPSGDLKTLPVGSTTLDFAFLIHSQIGYQCIGAKVNHK